MAEITSSLAGDLEGMDVARRRALLRQLDLRVTVTADWTPGGPLREHSVTIKCAGEAFLEGGAALALKFDPLYGTRI